jgi:hypothetical protein
MDGALPDPGANGTRARACRRLPAPSVSLSPPEPLSSRARRSERPGASTSARRATAAVADTVTGVAGSGVASATRAARAVTGAAMSATVATLGIRNDGRHGEGECNRES